MTCTLSIAEQSSVHVAAQTSATPQQKHYPWLDRTSVEEEEKEEKQEEEEEGGEGVGMPVGGYCSAGTFGGKG